jgi:hypothetical protein
MIVDGVNFVEGACQKMTKEEFIEHHKDAFWLDRDEAVREHMLADAYDMMSPPAEEGKKKKSASKTEKK